MGADIRRGEIDRALVPVEERFAKRVRGRDQSRPYGLAARFAAALVLTHPYGTLLITVSSAS